jgi:copper(I)-binding protein
MRSIPILSPLRAASVTFAAVAAAACLAACSSSGSPSHTTSDPASPATPRSTSTTSTSTTAPPGTAQATIGDLTITGGYIPQPASTDVAAAYLTVANRGTVADTITKVTTSVTLDVRAMTEATSGGIGTMTEFSVTVPAHGSISLAPGHAHLMLQKPTRLLRDGDKVSMTITFSHAGTITLTLPVVPITGPVNSSSNMAGMPGMPGTRS